MLIRFVASNFLSFNEEVEFNMLAGSYRTHKHHVYKAGKLKVLKGAAIYGANGAGKSNFVKAIDYLKKLIEKGGLNKTITQNKFKLDSVNRITPTEFEIEFYYKRKIYAYGLSINDNNIIKEWLYISGINKEDKLIFEREKGKNGEQTINLTSKYLKTQKDRLLIELMEENLLKDNELFLGKWDSLKIKDINNVWEWFHNNLCIVYPNDKYLKFFPAMVKPKEFTKLNRLLKTFNTGLNELKVESTDLDTFFGKDNEIKKKTILEELESVDNEYLFTTFEQEKILIAKKGEKGFVKKLVGIHENRNNEKIIFDLTEESEGTQRLIDFIPVIDLILNSGATFVIDEIDQSLHPTLLYTLVKKIMDEQNTKGQLIFTTHESSLLDMNIFRQDEIWFVEKNKSGSTQLYSLSDFKPRYDLDIRKGYLKGRFGAIPFIADLKNLNWQKDDA